MSTGSVRTLLVCEAGPISQAPCPAGQAPAFLQAYVLEPGSSSFFDAAIGPFDYTSAGAFWSAAFIFTLTLYFGTRMIGAVVNMTK